MPLGQEENTPNKNNQDDVKIEVDTSQVNEQKSSNFWPIFAISAFIDFAICSIPFLLFLFVIFIHSWWIVAPIGYILWVIYDKSSCEKSERRSEYFRRWRLWKLMREYFPLTLVKTVELPANRNYVFGLHPHGMSAASHFFNFGTESTGISEMFPGIHHTLVVHGNMFVVPFFRELMLWLGIRSVSSQSIDYLLSRQKAGNAVAIVVGGFKGFTNAGQDPTLLILKTRKGFVRKALTHGASLVPVFTYGEDDLFTFKFKQGSLGHRIIHKIFSMTGIKISLYVGRGLIFKFGLIPLRRKLVTVVGKPIFIDKSYPNLTEEEVDEFHQKYLQEMRRLYEDNKHLYSDNPCKPLQFI